MSETAYCLAVKNVTPKYDHEILANWPRHGCSGKLVQVASGKDFNSGDSGEFSEAWGRQQKFN